MILFVNENRGILFLRKSLIKVLREFIVKITKITRERIVKTATWKQ